MKFSINGAGKDFQALEIELWGPTLHSLYQKKSHFDQSKIMWPKYLKRIWMCHKILKYKNFQSTLYKQESVKRKNKLYGLLKLLCNSNKKCVWNFHGWLCREQGLCVEWPNSLSSEQGHHWGWEVLLISVEQ